MSLHEQHNLPAPVIETTVDFMFYYQIWREFQSPSSAAKASYSDPFAEQKAHDALAASPFVYDPNTHSIYNSQVLHNIGMLARVQGVKVPYEIHPNQFEATVDSAGLNAVMAASVSPVQTTLPMSTSAFPDKSEDMGSPKVSEHVKGLLTAGSLAKITGYMLPEFHPMYHTIERDGFAFYPDLYSLSTVSCSVVDTYKLYLSPLTSNSISSLMHYIHSVFSEYETSGAAYSFMNTHPMVGILSLCKSMLKIMESLRQSREFNLDSKFRAIVTDVLPYLPDSDTLRHCADVAASLGAHVNAPNAQTFPEPTGFIPQAMIDTLTLVINLAQELSAVRKRLILDNDVTLKKGSSALSERIYTMPFKKSLVLDPVYGFSDRMPSSVRLFTTHSNKEFCSHLGRVIMASGEIAKDVRRLLTTVSGSLCEVSGEGFATHIDPNKDSFSFATDGLQHFAVLRALHTQAESLNKAATQVQSALHECDSAASIVMAARSALHTIPMGWSLYSETRKVLPTSRALSALDPSLRTIVVGIHTTAKNLTEIIRLILTHHHRDMLRLTACSNCNQITTLTPPRIYSELKQVLSIGLPSAKDWPPGGSLCVHCIAKGYRKHLSLLSGDENWSASPIPATKHDLGSDRKVE